jgi:hypothetical protein
MSKIDCRTKEGQEAAVLAQVEKHGGFSVFWVTENQKRAHAAERLQDRGAIIRDGGAFPWCAYEVPNVELTGGALAPSSDRRERG